MCYGTMSSRKTSIIQFFQYSQVYSDDVILLHLYQLGDNTFKGRIQSGAAQPTDTWFTFTFDNKPSTNLSKSENQK